MLEEVRKACHHRTESTHIIMIPRLMTPMWQKHLNKVSDIVLSIPAGHRAWPSDMHEPLTIGIVEIAQITIPSGIGKETAKLLRGSSVNEFSGSPPRKQRRVKV